MKTTYSIVPDTKLNIDDLLKDFQVLDHASFSCYLTDIWKVK